MRAQTRCTEVFASALTQWKLTKLTTVDALRPEAWSASPWHSSPLHGDLLMIRARSTI